MWTGVHLEKAVEDQAAKKGLHRQQQEQETQVLWAGFSFSTRATSCHAAQQQGAWPEVIQNEQGQFFSRCSIRPLQLLCLASPAATHTLANDSHGPFSLCWECSHPQGSLRHLIQVSARSFLIRWDSSWLSKVRALTSLTMLYFTS